MKKQLRNLFLMMPLALPVSMVAQHSTPKHLETVQASQKWITMKTENGIEASYSESVNGKNNYMVLQLKNVSKESINFSWSLKDTHGKTVAETKRFTLAPGASVSGLDDATMNGGNMMILLTGEQQAAGLTLSINKIN
jgi:hypothetical protein